MLFNVSEITMQLEKKTIRTKKNLLIIQWIKIGNTSSMHDEKYIGILQQKVQTRIEMKLRSH